MQVFHSIIKVFHGARHIPGGSRNLNAGKGQIWGNGPAPAALA
jgi:hypothetical protein